MTGLRDLLEHPVRFHFFTGKGGVGKTSLACATSVGLADRGRRTLLVSTDPASNLDAVLGVTLANTPSPVPGAAHLLAMNIDPDAAARGYRERTIAPYRGTVPDAELAQIEEQLAGACTVEVAAFDEFTVLLGQDELMQSVDHVVFDTAPTGHTLRMLQLPAAWSRYLDTSTTAVSCLGPLAGLKAQQSRYQEAVRTLGDAAATTLVLVARPDRVALLEAERTRTELSALGMQNQVLIVNAVFHATERHDAVALAVEERGTGRWRTCHLAYAHCGESMYPGTVLIYNGSIAFSITGLFLVSAAWATLDSGVLPRWTGWLAHMAAALCLISVPAMFSGAVDAAGFYNAGGWGPAIIANFPPLIWFLVVGVVLIRRARADANTPVVAQQRRSV